ncbi:SDR family NAD(P)-dependent oxidoreductase [Streptomyces sp. SID8111]|uniref:SDR family NAD(P)-dependent oxidoreductase n=1 Tax=Streptomyces sp. SID8111 TaxID=2706100 RepID=UPI0013C07BE0|nr:SDR family NAD(P)-dependent oxidoreductase [Streptomyces sp. SID8111]NEC26369.1 SDR family NAD(P)-dependent oxidoreductase [Streptomyces sp. SID8111]
MHLTDVAAVVTGGASGLGAATARALAAAGAQVHALDLSPALETAPAVPGVRYLAADVTNEQDIRAAVTTAATGGAPLRVVVNCAGIAPSARVVGRKGAHDLGLYADVVRVNLVGTFTVLALGAEAIARTEPLADGQRGVIVNTASIAAYEGQVGQAAYASSKAGVVGLTLPAARDLAQYGIRVNTVAPGIVDTPMMATVSEEYRAGLAEGVPFPRRFSRPEEYAQLVMMIITHDYLNGETVRMDGALRMPPR